MTTIGAFSARAADVEAERLASLRLTHILYSAVLDRYTQDGLTKYRPDFLLHDRYIRTFLFEWGHALDKGVASSTQEIWSSISRRNSYLGAHFDVWKRVVPHAFEKRGDGVNLGFYREGFLVSVLRSETNPNFTARSHELLEMISRDLLTQSADQELGLKLLEAFVQHPDGKLRESAAAVVRRFPAFSNTIAVLGLGRDVALAFAGGKGAAPIGKAMLPQSLTARFVALTATQGQKAAAAANALKLAKLRVKNAIRFPELLSSVKLTSLQKAFAVSGAIHGAAAVSISATAEKSNDATRKTAEPESSIYAEAFGETQTPISFLAALALNTASVRSAYLLEQRDFEWSARGTTSMTKENWKAHGQGALHLWNSRGHVPARFSLSMFVLEGERIFGYWPKDEKLARVTLESRYLRIKQRLTKMKIDDITQFRREVLENELADYRGQRRTLTSMMLDWGGNCVSQTLTMISLLLDFPHLTPSGTQLGVFLSPTHMEAVHLTQNEIRFLVSGKVQPRDESVTILKPQALLAMALSAAGDDLEVSLKNAEYYLVGKPSALSDATPSTVWNSLLAGLDRVKRLDFESGLGMTARLPIKGGVQPVDAPSHSSVGFKDFANVAVGAVHGAPTSSGKGVSDGDSSLRPPRMVPIGNGYIPVCVKDWNNQNEDPCRDVRPRPTPVATYTSAGAPVLKQIDVMGYLKVFMATGDISDGEILVRDPEARVLLDKTPDELFVLQLHRWVMADLTRNANIEDLDGEALERAESLTLVPGDIRFLFNRNVSLGTTDIVQDFSKSAEALQASAYFLLNLDENGRRNNTTFPRVNGENTARQLSAYSYDYLQRLEVKLSARPAMKRLATNRPLEKVRQWFAFNDAIMRLALENPKGFVEAFSKLDPETKYALVNWARRSPERRFFDNVMNYLNGLSQDQVSIQMPPAAPTQKAFSVSAINTPTCHGEGCRAFKVLEAAPPALEKSAPSPKLKPTPLSSSAGGERLKIDAQDLVLLSLFTRGAGIQLWDAKVYEAIKQYGFDWIRGGVELGDTTSTWGNSKYAPHVQPEAALRNVMKRYARTVLHDRETIEKQLPRSTDTTIQVMTRFRQGTDDDRFLLPLFLNPKMLEKFNLDRTSKNQKKSLESFEWRQLNK